MAAAAMLQAVLVFDVAHVSVELQARDITSDVTSSDKYKSIALHAEVKLAGVCSACALSGRGSAGHG
jgi:hypothetical protein